MQLQFVTLNPRLRLAALATLLVSMASAATFGRVVPIGGHASDIALDEPRGVLYIANYTASRIDVMSLANSTIGRSISVPAYPGSLALSPDGHYLVVAHYASSAGASLFQPGQDALTVLDLTANQRRTFGLPSGPIGIAFAGDGLALIATQDQFLLFDPVSGKTDVIGTVANVTSQVLPVDKAAFPPEIIAGQLTATADGRHILGIGGVTPDNGTSSVLTLFSYRAADRRISAQELFTATPSLAPRVIAPKRDGTSYMTGWALFGCGLPPGFPFLGDCAVGGPLLSQWPNIAGDLNVGSVAMRSSKALIYAQFIPAGPPPPATNSQTVCLPNGTCVTVTGPPSSPAPASQTQLPPTLLILDDDNLTVRDRVQIPENLAGRSVFSADESMLYSISDSGVTVFSMAQLERAPRVLPSAEDVVFRGNFCNSGPLTQELDIVDPAGNATPFQVCVAGSKSCAVPGITISPASAVTPARVKITVDPTVIGGMIGTKAYTFEILSATAVNMPPPPSRGRIETYVPGVRSRFRVLLNNRLPENRGAFINAPGELVDLLADPGRNRFYVLRQDKNQVLVYDSTTYNLIATLRTGNTPTQMAITFGRNYLLVGHDNSQLAYRYDLNTLKPVEPVVFPLGHYPRSIAASAKAVLAASRVAGPIHTIDSMDLFNLIARPLPSLGPYKNDVNISTTLIAAPNGSSILAAMPDGNLMLYSANADSFVVSRQDFKALKGAYAASSYQNYMVDHYLFNESLVQIAPLLSDADSSSGYAFIDRDGVSTAVRATNEGYIQRASSSLGQQILPTGIVEAPLIGDADFPFTRTLAPLPDQSALIALTTSGFTVLPWNYDAPTAVPVLDAVVNSADFTQPVAPGGLISLFGSQLSSMTLAATDVPLPTVLADSCLTVNGLVVPMQFVSPGQINAQLPFQMNGTAAVVLHTPGGVSDALNITILSAAPAVFRSGTAGPVSGIPTLVRATNQELVTNSNPIHPNDHITIYLTGMGPTSPEVDTGTPAPFDVLAWATIPPAVTLGGVSLPVEFAGLTPGSVGLYQINVAVPFKGLPTGFDIPMRIVQGGVSTSVPVRVVD